MAKLVVTYPSTPNARFDADYYLATHIPLVRAKWAAHGLTDASALLPDQADAPFAAIALLAFRDKASIEAALGSVEAEAVFGDLPNFTDIAPQPMLAKDA
ncbi:EthD family reductase [Sphingomonas crocodyli]|uniref:EthD family reductase n=1 Tax=Sphingomonas crocodyli TaxID=1979270 RepID=A0A437M5S5_9SPHN|nr:EthD family reductase [Sphingomonas crocodyli]RVT93022.1 EthD family reductase [Sphingomonas crocodyli]